ncbi:MFS transporter [Corynebacterium sp. P7003]|uniref:MFS transporter n=1 Tax=Corynebacterium pygosceleis TaxID=2800406 RepID=A0ABT3WRI7_9CORY|nr:MFS transporter [Corynebacterium pygosceleis]MCX7444741.1 MFS transporter [Corynebacterium pygosceleis]
MSTDPRTVRSLRLMALAWCATTAQVGVSAVPVVLPAVAAWSDGGPGTARWIVTAFLLGMTAVGPVVGYLGDLLGRDRVLLGAAVLFTATAALCALAPSPGVLIAARAIQGAAGAALAVLLVAAVRDLLTVRRSGSGLGLLGSATAAGTAAGPVLAGVLVDAIGWRAVFWMLACLSLSTAVLLRATRGGTGGTHPVGRPRRRPDIAGAVLLMVAVLAYAAACGGAGGSPARAVGLLAVAVTALVVLHRIESRAPRPLLPGWLLGSPTVRRAVAHMVVVGAVMMSTLVIGPFHLSAAHGLAPRDIGLIMALGPLTSVVAGVVTGRFVTGDTAPGLTVLGLAWMGVAVTVLAVGEPWLGVPGYVAGTVLLAPGYQLFMAANNMTVLESVPGNRRGTAAGILGLARNIGLVTGSAALGSVFLRVAGATDSGTAFTVTYGAVSAVLLVTVLACAVDLHRSRCPTTSVSR